MGDREGVLLPPVTRSSKIHHPPAALPQLSWDVIKACEKPLGMALHPEGLCISYRLLALEGTKEKEGLPSVEQVPGLTLYFHGPLLGGGTPSADL